MIEKKLIEDKLSAAFADAMVLEVRDLTGTQDHYEATVVSGVFAGKSRIEQHQLVYRALGTWVGKEIHALALNTFTPDAWATKLGDTHIKLGDTH